ncbi:MAG: hypothetical protein AAF553_07175 [Pseudomonadota bacterium]
MIFTVIATSLLALQSAPEATDQPVPAPAPEAAPAEQADPNIEVVEKRPEKITDKKHPDYVRCKSESVIGSRAKRKRTCMTNREWALSSRRGNEATRDFVGDNQAGFQPGTGGLGN